jgi:hypothetical protein
LQTDKAFVPAKRGSRGARASPKLAGFAGEGALYFEVGSVLTFDTRASLS